MSLTVFLTVLGAALLHAVWNALVKGGQDKGLAMAVVVIGQGAFGALALLAAPLPLAESLPWVALSIAIHLGYQLFLLNAYRIGDMTQVYPIARGSAPLIVAAVTVFGMGVALSQMELAAILLIGCGIFSLCLVRQADGLRNRRAAGFALLTGAMIAGYSLADGTGARASDSPVGYYGAVAFGNALVLLALMRGFRPGLAGRLPGAWRLGLVGGGASFLAYAIVVWAFTQAPIALVTALRETSVVFGLLIGVGFLGERLNLARVASTMFTLSGAALLRLSR